MGTSRAVRRHGLMGSLSLLSLLALFVMGPCTAFAQSTPWGGNDVKNVVTDDDTSSSESTVFLYNVATGMFLNQGGYWGTTSDVRTVGLPVTIYTYDNDRSGDTITEGGSSEDSDTEEESTDEEEGVVPIDVTSSYLLNPSFENDDVASLDSVVADSTDGLRGWTLTAPTGWTVSGTTSTSEENMKQLLISAACFTDNNFGKVTTIPDGDYAYYLRMGWSTGETTLSQTASSLPAGDYIFTVDQRNAYTNTATTSSFTLSAGSTSNDAVTFSAGTTSYDYFPSLDWTTDTVAFTVTEASDVELSIAITWSSGGSCIMVDNFKLCSINGTDTTDITSDYLTNPSFENDETTSLTASESGSSTTDGRRGWTIAPPTNWSVSSSLDEDSVEVVTLLVNADCFTDNNFGKVTTLSDGDYAYYLRVGWSTGTTTLSQTVSNLPAGSYRISMDQRTGYVNDATSTFILSAGGTNRSAVTFSEGSTSNDHFTSLAWTTKSLDFTVAEEGDVTISVTITWASGGSCIMMDNFKLYSLIAATDATDDYLTNPSFENDSTSTLSEVTNSSDGLRGWTLTEPDGWTVSYTGTEPTELLVSADCYTDNNFGLVTTIPDGTYAYYLRMGWDTGTTTLSQTLSSLPAGSYRISMDQRTGYANTYSSSTSFVLSAGDTSNEAVTFSPGSTDLTYFPNLDWTNSYLDFTVATESDVTISVTITWASGGSCIMMDNFKLYAFTSDDEDEDDSDDDSSSSAPSTLTTYGSSDSAFPYQISAGVQKATDETNYYDAFLGYVTSTTGEAGYDTHRAMLDCTTGQGLTGVAFVQETDSDDCIYYICLNTSAGYIDRDDFASSATVASDSAAYLVAQLNEDGTEYEAVVKRSISTDSLAYAQWQIVTLQDLKDNFSSTEGSFADPVDATFLITDPNFHRRNLSLDNAWAVTHGGSTTGGWVRGWIADTWVSDVLNNTDTATVIATMGFNDDITACDGTIWETEVQRYFCRLYGRYYTANILWPESSTDSVTVLQSVDPDRAGWYEVSCKGFQYGTATGWLYASATESASGTSNTSTQVALYSLDSTSDWEGISFEGDDAWGDADITDGDSVTARAVLHAGQLLTDLETYEDYEALGYVYVDDASAESGNLVIGVVANHTSGLGWVAFDDVELRYLGNVTQYIVLDETDTALTYGYFDESGDGSSTKSRAASAADEDGTDDDTTDEDTSTDGTTGDNTTNGSGQSSVEVGLNDQLQNAIKYGKSKVETNGGTASDNMTNYAFVLSRPLVDGVWNSLVLPVDLTPSQLLGIFGTNYRLAQFTGVSVVNDTTQTIKFTSVVHDSLHAGYLYIVKPTSSTLHSIDSETNTASFVTPMSAEGGVTDNFQKDITNSYYLVPQVSFPASAVSAGSYGKEVTNEGIEAMSADNGYLYFHGTYIKQESRLNQGSYVVGRISDGNGGYTYGWYHYTGDTPLTIKGFRTWIEPESSTSTEDTTEKTSVASVLYFSIDGEVDETLSDAVATGLVSIPVPTTTAASTAQSKTDNRVYSLSGQLIREGGSLDNLAKGVYLLNGQKYIVK